MDRLPAIGLALALATTGCGEEQKLPEFPELCTLQTLRDHCGYNLGFVAREEWGAPLATQNEGVMLPSGTALDSSDPALVEEALLNDIYPPYTPWPQSEGFPSSYAIGDQLNAQGYGWYANMIEWPPSKLDFSEITSIVIHHTGSEVSEGGDCEEYVRWVTGYHTFGKDHGWGDIGYNGILCRKKDGSVVLYQGRAPVPDPEEDSEKNPLLKASPAWTSIMDTEGAHAAGHNKTSIGYAVVEGMERDPSPEELEVLSQLAARTALVLTGSKNRSIEILGHKDVVQPGHETECPGNIYSHLNEIRARVAQCTQCRSDLRGEK